MVCLACLLPLFLIPIVNLLPILFDMMMAKIYRLCGWEYRKPQRVPPACPYKPSASTTNPSVDGESVPVDSDNLRKRIHADGVKQE